MIFKATKRTCLQLTILFLSSSLVSTVWSQASATETEVAPRGRVIEEVVVTATKREESVRDIAASIDAFQGEQLNNQGAQGIDDFLRASAGVSLSDDGLLRRITIRGISSSQLTSATTGVLIGDIPFNNPYVPRVQLDPNLFDMGTIEVLKGPQGTLFGGSSLNGAVRYSPNMPEMERWGFKAFSQVEQVESGGMGTISGAALNVPLGQAAALRLVGHDRESAGWIDLRQLDEKDANTVSQEALRVLGRWDATERLQLDLIAMTQDQQSNALAATRTDTRWLQNAANPTFFKTNFEFASLRGNYMFDAFDLTAQITRLNKEYEAFIDNSIILEGQVDNPPSPLAIAAFNENVGTIGELRLTSSDEWFSNWRWIVGLFSYEVDIFEDGDYFSGAGASPVPLPDVVLPVLAVGTGADGIYLGDFVTNIDFVETAAFGEASYLLGERWEFTLGLRYYITQLEGSVVGSGAIGSISGGGDLTGGKSEGDFEERGLSPKFAAKFIASDALTLYANAARGFRFGGIQLIADPGTGEVPPTYESDSLWSYELGLRSQWLDNTLIADAALFYLDWTDAQLNIQNATGCGCQYVLNVGEVEVKGFEASFQYLPPIDGLSLSLTGAYVDAKTAEDFTDPAGNFTPEGTPWPQTAKYQTNTSIAYERLLGDWRLETSLTHSHQGEGWAEIPNTTRIFDFETWSAQLAASNESWKVPVRLGLSVTNLTDEMGVVGGFPSVPTVRSYIRPRTITLRLGFDL